MPASDLYKQFQYISNIEHIAEGHGMTIEVSADFDAFRQIRTAQQDRLPISPIFDRQVSELNASNGFWIKGSSESGELVHLQAVRLESLTDTTLAEHLRRHRDVYAPPGVEAPRRDQGVVGAVCRPG